MYRVVSIPCLAFVLLLLASCAAVDQRSLPVETASAHRVAPVFEAWGPDDASRPPLSANSAVRELLAQADRLIAQNALANASDKLERLLRIEPAYAQAWSRLAWIALQQNAANRGRQMAQRSNSYVYDNSKLKALNWTFIMQAGELMNDPAAVHEAEQMIRALGGAL